MPLKFEGQWLITPPADGWWRNQEVGSAAVEACLAFIMKVAPHGPQSLIHALSVQSHRIPEQRSVGSYAQSLRPGSCPY